MHYRKLGSSDLEVSTLSFGAWQLGDPSYWGGDSAEAEGAAAVDAALDVGINLFDTAEMYGAGESERALGRMLGDRRKDVYIASKVSPNHCAPGRLREACETSLARLKTDVIDLYQIHWPPRDVKFEDAYDEMRQLQKEGKIRHIGVSNFGPKDLDAWAACGGCVSDQLGYNLLFRAIEHEIVPVCAGHEVGILAYMPLMQGLLAGRWQNADEIPAMRRRTRHFSSEREGTRHGEDGCEGMVFEVVRGLRLMSEELGAPMASVATAWLMAKPGVTSVIVGARNAEQVKRNIGAAELALEGDVVARLDGLSQQLKERLGTNCDMWCGEEESRIR
jgi:aryl-alcohol dehydrogenase-like predicted oxidoreductase